MHGRETALRAVLAALVVAGAVGSMSGVALGAGPSLTAAAFASPAADFRPFSRYWVPGGLAEPAQVAADIRNIAQSGQSGAEFNYLVLIQRYDAGHYGYGSPAYVQALQAALESGRDNGVQVDLMPTPSWPLSDPTITPQSDAAAKQLVFGRATVSGGTTFTGPVPTPTQALPAGVTNRALIDVQAVRCVSACAGSAPVMLDPDSVIELSSSVGQDGTLTWTAPAGGDWLLFGFYAQGSGQVATGAPYAPTPAYVVDHFSRAGTDQVINFWDQKLLTPQIRELLRSGAGAMFEDSYEVTANWTTNLLDEFQRRRGYSLRAGLAVLPPALYGGGQLAYDFPGDAGARIREDYLQTLQELYMENHLRPLRDWAHGLGMKFRLQPYGGAFMNMSQGMSEADIPEGEDLGFNGTAQGQPRNSGANRWRAAAGAAHTTGKSIVSDECCPGITDFTTSAYGIGWDDMLTALNQNLATGANRIVYHGYSYNAPSLSSVWPGWAAFDLSPFLPGIGETWDPRQPTWSLQGPVDDYLGRAGAVLRQGRPQVDLAIYYDGNVDDASGAFADQGLARRGYSYDLLDDTLLASPAARVEGHRLAPDRAAYRALILNNRSVLALDTARRILDDARAGLPVIIVGDTPARTPGHGDDTALRAVVDQLLALSDVTRAATEAAVPGKLSDLGLDPAVEFSSASPLVAQHRVTDDADYYFLYNTDTASAADTTVSLPGAGRPYALDLWSGKIRPLAQYTRTATGVSVAVHLAPFDTMAIAVSRTALDGSSDPAAHVVQTDADSAVYAGSDLRVRTTRAGRYTTRLDDGRTAVTDVARAPAPIALDHWSLQVTSWEPGATVTQTNKVSRGPIPVSADANGVLPDWTQIHTPVELQDTSGVGTYTTTFSWDGGDGAYLDLGQIANTFDVVVNDTKLAPVDIIDPRRIDISQYLHSGSNDIHVTNATTLRNRLRIVPGSGQAPLPRQRYGLIGPVRVLPFVETPVYRETSAGASIGGTVPATLSLSLGSPASFGAFTPGVDRNYDASVTANVISTAGDAKLSVSDPASNATGRLVNGSFALDEPLQAKANAGAFAPLSTTAGSPLALLTYPGPVSNDAVTVGLRQHIGATQPLRTGAYNKTLTFTLSTTTP